MATTSVLLTTTGAGSWTVPSGVSSVDVECWGAGGGGGGSGGNSGGGGAYSKATLAVTQNTLVAYSIGAGTTLAGGDTYFVNSSTVMAKGGERAPGGGGTGGNGAASASVGTTKYDGGAGRGVGGYGGGGAASSGGAGNVGLSVLGGAAGTGGGAGGGASTVGVSNVEGGGGGGSSANGGAPGGGGGSGFSGDSTGGRGQIRITYEIPESGKFGNETPVGGSSQGTSTQVKWARPYTVGPADVQISKITIYVNSVSSGSPEYRPLIYADSGGAPGALVVAGSDVATSATGPVDLPFAPGAAVLTANTTYWFGFQRNGASINFPNNTISPPITANTNSDTFSDGPSDPFGSPSTSSAGPPFAAYWANYEPLKYGTFDFTASSDFIIFPNLSQGDFALSGQASFAAYGDLVTVGQLGTTPAPPGASGSSSQQIKRARAYTSPGSAVLATRIQVYRTSAAASSQMRGVIYDASGAGGIPGNLVAQGDIITHLTTGLVDLPFSTPVPLSPSTSYWFGVMKNAQSIGFSNTTATYAQNTDTFSDGATATWGTNSAQASGPSVSVSYQSALAPPILGFFNLDAMSSATFDLTQAGGTIDGEFDFSASGTLTCALEDVTGGRFDLTASGLATFAAKLIAAGITAPTATSNATQAGKLQASGAAALSAAADALCAGRQIFRSGFALSGSGTLTLAASAAQGAFALTGNGTATNFGSLTASGIAAASASFTAVTAGGLLNTAAFALTASATATLAGDVYILGGFDLSAVASASSLGILINRSSAAFTAQGTFALDEAIINVGTFALSAESLVTFEGIKTAGGSFALTGASASANAAVLAARGAFGLTASASATIATTSGWKGAFALRGNTALGVSATMVYRSVGFALTGSSSFKVFLQPTYTPPPKPPRALITIPPSAPTWAHMLVNQINQFFTTPFRPYHPTRLYEVERPQDLPDATKYIHSLVFVVSIKRLAVSDGVNWIRQDTGAAL